MDTTTNLVKIPIEKIQPDTSQPRKYIIEEDIEGLANSIKETGLCHPIIVRPQNDGTYIIVDGVRRYLAYRHHLKKKTMLCAVRSDLEDKDTRIVFQLVANIQREDLSPIEVAQALKILEKKGLTHEEIGKKVGLSRPSVTNKLRLLDLPPKTQEKLNSGEMSEREGLSLVTQNNPDRNYILRRERKTRTNEKVYEKRRNFLKRFRKIRLEDLCEVPIEKLQLSGTAIQEIRELVRMEKSSIEIVCSNIIETAVYEMKVKELLKCTSQAPQLPT